MRLGLLGYPIGHSRSPELYRRLLGAGLDSYELFSYDAPAAVPPLAFFRDRVDGLSITAPYKRHFLGQIEVPDRRVADLGSVNTLAFLPDRVLGTNTDLVAVVEILGNYRAAHPNLSLVLLGDGAMAKVTVAVAASLGIPLRQFSRKTYPELARLDVAALARPGYQTIVINSCSRGFVFRGPVSGDEIFWDYNYALPPHAEALPGLVKAYDDGREMLERQARAAIEFWREHNPKLK